MKIKSNAKAIAVIMLIATMSCRKEALPAESDPLGRIISPLQVNVSFHATIHSYKKYEQPVDQSPEKIHKLFNTYSTTMNYDAVMNVNNGSVYYSMDNIVSDCQIDDWNSVNTMPYKIVNDGTNCNSYDQSGKLISTIPAEYTGITPQEIYMTFLDIIDRRPIEEQIQELKAKGADVQESPDAYFIRTFEQNPNFKKNTLAIYNKNINRLVCMATFSTMLSNRIESLKLIKYETDGNPKEVYQESYNYLPDGDKETSVEMMYLRNTIINY